jgi:hypothetical protein
MEKYLVSYFQSTEDLAGSSTIVEAVGFEEACIQWLEENPGHGSLMVTEQSAKGIQGYTTACGGRDLLVVEAMSGKLARQV